MLNNVTAVGYLLRGLKLITKPALRKFVIIPFIINLIIFSCAVWVGSYYFDQLIQMTNQHLPSWLQWLQWVLWLIFGLLSIVIVFYSFTIFANVIAAPFNGLLAEQIEIYLTGIAPPTPTRWQDVLKSLPIAFMRQMKLLMYYLLRSVVLWLLMFIPIINGVAIGVWFLFTAWMACLQYMDYPMDNHRISFHDMRQLLAEKRLAALSFGAMIILFTMIPILNFLVMPAGVAGATLFWVEEFKSHRK